ncbi:glycosyltransferase family 87 protein [Mucilaginibacter sp.]
MKISKGFKLTCLLWLAVSVAMWGFKYFNNRYNNYLIFKHVYYHAKAETNLYNLYPGQHEDSNHYGPLFSVLIAPFAVMPDAAGLLLWNVFNAAALIAAIYLLPLTMQQKTFILLFGVLEFAAAQHYIQFNAVIAAIIIVSFLLVDKEKDEWATLLISLGMLIKLYPVVGLAFFIFSKHKKRFVLSGLSWTALFVLLPMLITSPHFALQSYADWYQSLQEKNGFNIGFTSSQDICLMGAVRRLSGNVNVPNWPFLLMGAAIFAVPLFRFNQFRSLQFRLQVLASALIMVVIFSTGSEHPTYVIAMMGALLWIFMQKQPFNTRNILLLASLIIITGLGPIDVCPKYIRHEYINKYVMKAWPCIAVWLIISWELCFKQFVQFQEAERGDTVEMNVFNENLVLN